MQVRLPIYETGTVQVSLVSSAWTVTGAGTNFIAPDGVAGWSIAKGDTFLCDNQFGIVGDVTAANVFKLMYWSGGAIAAGANYSIIRYEGLGVNGFSGLLQNISTLGKGDKGDKGDTVVGPVGPPGSFINRLHNPQFWVNQRGFGSGGSLSVGAYGHDRWKAGAAGCSYSYSADGIYTQINIISGSLVQVIDGTTIEGGDHVLSWVGTAQCKVNGGTAANSPIVIPGLPANTNVTLEVLTGSFRRSMFQPGTTPSAFEFRHKKLEELLFCWPFYYRGSLTAAAVTKNGYGTEIKRWLPVPLRIPGAPTFNLWNESVAGPITVSDRVASDTFVRSYVTGTADAGFIYSADFDVSRDL